MTKYSFILKTIFVVFVCVTCYVCRANARTYKVALIHSYEEGYEGADALVKMLKKELRAQDINCELREYYLDCDGLLSYEEEARCFLFANDFTRWGADLVALLDDQAAYSFMASKHPQVSLMPIVFAGVNYPNEKLLKNYPNVTGYVDTPDYLRTIHMIERIMGKSRVCVINGQTYLDRQVWKDLMEQCKDKGFAYLQEELRYHVTGHRTVKDSLFTVSIQKMADNERFDTTTIIRLATDSLSLRELTWVGRGSRTFLLETKRDYTTINMSALFRNPCFETINEGFGVQDHKIGGYFATPETQMRDLATGIATRLRGEMPPQQIQQSLKQYVLNWHTLKRYNIPMNDLPAECIVMYVPFVERYFGYFLWSSILLGTLLLYLLCFLTHSLIRERKRKREAQRNLLYEHETLTLAIEGSLTYAWRLEKDMVFADAQFYELLHCSHNGVKLEEVLRYVHPDDVDSFRMNLKQVLDHPRHSGQYRCCFYGEYQWWEFRYNTILNADRMPIITGLLLNVQDVKDREEELIKARKLAERAELKQSFLNNMSHEIRTPLNAIAGFSNMLTLDSDLEETERIEYVDIINRNTELLLKLVDDVLELSRIESGSLSFKWRRENLRVVLERVYQTHRVLVHSPLELCRSFPDEDVYVYVDAMRLTQVLTNFLNNANKFTKNGYIKLGYDSVPQHNEVRIYVEDTGMGISAEELNMIFGRFYKHNEFSQGVGLGLSICQLIVDKMEGRIEVESEVGKGSRFIVILPCVE